MIPTHINSESIFTLQGNPHRCCSFNPTDFIEYPCECYVDSNTDFTQNIQHILQEIFTKLTHNLLHIRTRMPTQNIAIPCLPCREIPIDVAFLFLQITSYIPVNITLMATQILHINSCTFYR